MTGSDRTGHLAGSPDSEAAAARYLGGALRSRAARAFEQHLLVCEPCWQEVEAGRAGRRIAESARQVAPLELRERLRAVVASQQSGAVVAGGPAEPGGAAVRRRRRVRVGVLGLSLGGVLAAVALLFVVGLSLPGRPAVARQPAAVGAAVADFRALRLPGALVPEAPAPDLTAVHLRSMGAAAGRVAGRPVTAYSYRDAAGRTVLVYLSKEPFPTAVGAHRLTGADGPWIAAIDGVTVLCARSPHALLVLGRDRELVLGVAHALDVT